MQNNNSNNVVQIPDPRLRNLRHVLLPGNFAPGFVATPLYNRVFSYWHQFWIDVLKGNGSAETINPYDFLRSNLISAILDGENVVSVHLYSILNFEQQNIIHHPYLAGEHEQCFIKAMHEGNHKTAMTVEFLTINANYRKSAIGISLAPVVAGIAYKTQQALGVDVMLGRCRTDVKSHILMTDVGGVTLKSNVMMHNTPVDFCVVYLKDLRQHPDPSINRFVARLWNNRTDYSALTTAKDGYEKRSA